MLDYDIRHGKTYMYTRKKPLYPFGFGLSYTQFRYANLRLNKNILHQNEKTNVLVDITNIGKRDGEEVVQIYVKGKDGVQRLKAFKRATVECGKTITVSLDLWGEDLAQWDKDAGCFTIQPGEVEILVGASSADIRLTTKLNILK
jgi:beta-glucosidase